jgi:hypothetical protein
MDNWCEPVVRGLTPTAIDRRPSGAKTEPLSGACAVVLIVSPNRAILLYTESGSRLPQS